MLDYGTKNEVVRQEIRCSDCAYKYLLLSQQISSRCPKCGNIEYLPLANNKVLPETTAPKDLAIDTNLLLQFRKPVSALAVDEVLLCYMQEWDLWAALVDHFDQPAFHSAYLTTVLKKRTLAHASQRYRKHLDIMRLIPGEQWQVSIAELQLTRLSQLQMMLSEREANKIFPLSLPLWIFYYERAQKAIWFIFGLVLWAVFISH